MSQTSEENPIPLPRLHDGFQSILPRIELHAGIHFRHIKCRQTREEKIAESIALAWKWYRQLKLRGKDPDQFPSALASFAVRAVKSGRRLCGQEKAKDVMSPLAQQRHGFKVERLPHSTATPHENLYGEINGQRQLDEFEERLRDNTLTPPPEQAAFRIDFPAWLRTWDHRHRQIIKAMSQDQRTKDLAERFGLSPARISQLRQQFHDTWEHFCNPDAGGPELSPA